jgi:lactaldehyde dehydrogenase / glycolaldehyde dehydrogenase
MLQNYINGQFVEAAGAAAIDVLNPARGTVISQVPDTPAGAVDEAVAAARCAQLAWERRPANERAGYLRRIGAKIRTHAEDIARTITEEQGKLLDLARIEANFTADYLDYMAEWARRIEGEILPSDRPGETILMFRKAIGVVGGILPWNFPFFLIARKMAPALITGNTIVIKPSEETPNNADYFTRLLAECDLPPGVFNIVHGRGTTVGQAISGHRDVDMVSFTGSVVTGSEIMRAAAANITKVNLELGGKAPAIVMADADLELAVGAIKASRVINSGQVCNCAERVYVHRKVADAFLAQFTAAMKQTTYGDPLGNQPVDMGPMINPKAAARVEAMVERARSAGAELLLGGRQRELAGGTYFEPTVLAGCEQASEIMQKEIFGPVIPVHVIDDLDEAIAKSNDSDYGLTSSIYTRDLKTALKATSDLKFGETYVNRENFEAMQGFHAGTRKSGIGGADGKHGLYEFTQTQMVYLQN